MFQDNRTSQVPLDIEDDALSVKSGEAENKGQWYKVFNSFHMCHVFFYIAANNVEANKENAQPEDTNSKLIKTDSAEIAKSAEMSNDKKQVCCHTLQLNYYLNSSQRN